MARRQLGRQRLPLILILAWYGYILATGNDTLLVSGTITLVWSNLGDVYEPHVIPSRCAAKATGSYLELAKGSHHAG